MASSNVFVPSRVRMARAQVGYELARYARTEHFWNNGSFPQYSIYYSSTDEMLSAHKSYMVVIRTDIPDHTVSYNVDYCRDGGRVVLKKSSGVFKTFSALVADFENGLLNNGVQAILYLAGRVEVWFSDFTTNATAVENHVRARMYNPRARIETLRHSDGTGAQQNNMFQNMMTLIDGMLDGMLA
jgi:hypothetical protein